MSDNIPLEIQLEIVNRLPLKSLLQCRSVSKTWKSLIDTSDFIKMHFTSHPTQVQHILVMYEDLIEIDYCGGYDRVERYVSIVDDHTFPEQKLSLTLPPLVDLLDRPRIIATSHGLLGLYGGIYRVGRRTDVVVLWNISIRKAVAVALPNVGEGMYGTALGFGVCRETSDPKIVKITYVDHQKTKGMESVTCNPPEVEVFTLSARAWRRSYGNGNLPRKSIQFCDCDKVLVDGVFYWLAKDVINVDGGFRYMIVSFDMTNEEFGEVNLPNSIANMGYRLSLYKRGESLVVVVEDEHSLDGVFDVWMMGDGVPNSFTKLCTVTPNADDLLAGFRNTGEPVFQTLVIDDILIDGSVGVYYAYQYMETLLLVDQPKFMVYE